jgi:hypothetical protein
MIEDSIIPAILGRPTFASLVVSNSIAFADLESTFPAASYSGRYAVVVINGMNVLMQSDGTAWKPANGQCTLDISGTGYGIMPSGTISTGASGHFVSGTALPHTYSEGLWMYIVSPSTTPALTAGFYWCVFSTTAICTIYQNGPGSAAYDFSVGGATTGSTAEITFSNADLPGGILGESGQLLWDMTYSQSGSANVKTTRVKINTSNVVVYQNTNPGQVAISNNGTITSSGKNAQYGKSIIGAILTSAINRTAEDTSVDFTVSHTYQMASATDYIIRHSWRLDLYKV